jgi:hypothetical protein
VRATSQIGGVIATQVQEQTQMGDGQSQYQEMY